MTLFTVSEKGLCGAIDQSGNIIIPITYQSIGIPAEGIIPARIDNKFIILDYTNKTVTSKTFDWLDTLPSCGRLGAGSDGVFGFVDTRGLWAIPPKFDEVNHFVENRSPVVYMGTYGYIDAKGMWIFPPSQQNLRHFSESCVAYEENAKLGFIDLAGNTLIEPQYTPTSVSYFMEGACPVYIDNIGFLINKKGEVISKRFPLIEQPFNGVSVVCLDRDGPVYQYYDVFRRETFGGPYQNINSFEQSVGCGQTMGGDWELLDRFGVITHVFGAVAVGAFSEGLAWAQHEDGLVGFIDKNGEWVIRPAFTSIRDFRFINGLAHVGAEMDYGYINKVGEWVWKTDR